MRRIATARVPHWIGDAHGDGRMWTSDVCTRASTCRACEQTLRLAMTPRLMCSFHATTYTANGIAFRIGQRSLGIDSLLRQNGVRSAVFLGADNPYSRRMPPGWNVRNRQRLRERLRRRQTAEGSGKLRNWSEKHTLVFGATQPSVRLARLMRQNGIVILKIGQPPAILPLLSIPAQVTSESKRYMRLGYGSGHLVPQGIK